MKMTNNEKNEVVNNVAMEATDFLGLLEEVEEYLDTYHEDKDKEQRAELYDYEDIEAIARMYMIELLEEMDEDEKEEAQITFLEVTGQESGAYHYYVTDNTWETMIDNLSDLVVGTYFTTLKFEEIPEEIIFEMEQHAEDWNSNPSDYTGYRMDNGNIIVSHWAWN